MIQDTSTVVKKGLKNVLNIFIWSNAHAYAWLEVSNKSGKQVVTFEFDRLHTDTSTDDLLTHTNDQSDAHAWLLNTKMYMYSNTTADRQHLEISVCGHIVHITIRINIEHTYVHIMSSCKRIHFSRR